MAGLGLLIMGEKNTLDMSDNPMYAKKEQIRKQQQNTKKSKNYQSYNLFLEI